MALTGDKAAIRRAARAAVASLDAATRAEASARIASHLAEHLREGLVLAYVALPDEVDLRPVLEVLAASGRLLLPKVGPQRTLTVHAVRDLALDLAPGAFQIAEPNGAVALAAPDVVLLPGRAFDAAGGRMGRGVGFYDRWLASVPRALRVGIGFEIQRVARVPMEAHDLPVDWLVTEVGAQRTGARGR